MADDAGWKIIEEKNLVETPHLTVVRERLVTPERPDGAEWLNVRRKQAVVIAPRTPDHDFILIHQERIPARRTFWEFPAGQIDGEVNERTLRETALRELEEEAGYAPKNGEMESMGGFFASPGFTNEYMHLFLASDVEVLVRGNRPDAAERILCVKAFSPQELRDMIQNGEIQDANTLCLSAKLIILGLFDA